MNRSSLLRVALSVSLIPVLASGAVSCGSDTMQAKQCLNAPVGAKNSADCLSRDKATPELRQSAGDRFVSVDTDGVFEPQGGFGPDRCCYQITVKDKAY